MLVRAHVRIMNIGKFNYHVRIVLKWSVDHRLFVVKRFHNHLFDRRFHHESIKINQGYDHFRIYPRNHHRPFAVI